MNRISSSYTWWIKWLVPLVLLAIPICIGWVDADARRGSLPVIGFLALLGLGALAVSAWFCFPLAGSVDDAGDALVVRRHGIEERVAMTNVMHVELEPASRYNPSRILLQLRMPGRFGSDIAFVPPHGAIDPDTGLHRLAQELQERAYQARSHARRETGA